MSSLFDGLGALTADIFGDTISVEPVGGQARDVQAVFREEPTPVLQRDNTETITVLPTLRAPKAVIEDLVRGSLVRPANGKTYRCGDDMPTKNPSDDGHRVVQLELVNAPE